MGSGLITDLYELTMAQGYLHYGRNPRVVFDMFYRSQPFGGGFAVFAGLQTLLEALESYRFSGEDLSYLESLKIFRRDFLDYLGRFRFAGEVFAAPEGSLVFPQEPLIRVHGTLLECQLIESLLLNIVNFQSLIATKAARVFAAAKEGAILEFGLRRAQGLDGALSASRAAYIGGASATSNAFAGMRFGIPVAGTMAHSWVMAFDSELVSFERYADLYPDKTILLIDTYNTLKSGINNAVRVGLRLKAAGKPFGVRLDSGDVQYLSHQVRKELDEAGLTDAKIAVSNELNEEIIHQLVADGCPIDIWGVGTHLVTGGSAAAFTGVYKLAAKEENGGFAPTMKVSDNPEKSSNPGIKQVYRFRDESGSPLADLICLDEEKIDHGREYTFHHPFADYRRFSLAPRGPVEPLLAPVMRSGKLVAPAPPLPEVRDRAIKELRMLDPTYKRILNPHIYKVSISDRLKQEKVRLIAEYEQSQRRSS